MSDIKPDLSTRAAVLEEIARSTARSIDGLHARLDSLNDRVDLLSERSDRKTVRSASLGPDKLPDYRWVIGLMLGGFGAILGLLAHGFHWL